MTMKSSRNLAATVAALLCLAAAPALAIVPIDGGAIALSPITVNNTAGDQFNPHVAPDLVVYSDPSQIHYWRFSTAVDTLIPAAASPATDLLSDVEGEQIVFTRVFSGGRRALMLFDAGTTALTELLPDANSNRFGSAIGGDTVVWVDYAIESHGEMTVYDLPTQTAIRLTNDTVGDQNPQVSPDASVIVWEHCPVSMLNCDIYRALRVSQPPPAAPTWTVSPLSEVAAAAEANPDTNGQLIVWESRVAAVWDVMMQTVSAPTTTRLELSGEENNPSISGGLVTFEHRDASSDCTDLFAYDIATNRVFQLTSSPAVCETLNDVVNVGPGAYRIAWTADEAGFDERNVYAANFAIPPVPSVSFDSAGQTVVEGDVVLFNVVMSGPSSAPANFHIYIGAGSTAGTADFASIMPVGITIPAGATEQQVGIYLADDSLVEGTEQAVLVIIPDDAGVVAGSQSTHTLTITDNDDAGSAYEFIGFFAPVDNPPTVNKGKAGKAGRAIPLKWQLVDANGQFVSDLSAIESITYLAVACETFPGSADALEATAPGASGLSYDAETQTFEFNWQTPKDAGCYELTVALDDGSTHLALFKLTK
jgi:hypothetical protein